MVPLVIAIVILAAYQFVLQRGQLLEELRNEAVAHEVLFASITKTVRDHVRALGTWGQIYLAEHDTDRPPPASGESRADRAEAGAAVAERLVPHMRLAHRAMPYLQRSYYLSADHDLLRVFPMLDGTESGDRLLDQELFQYGLAQGGAGREYWTKVYRDPEGAGWVVAHAIPISGDDGVVGVVGSTILLDFLTGFLRAFDYPTGRLWLVNEDDQILAASEGPTLAGLQVRTLAEVLPAPLRELAPPALLQPSAGFREINDHFVLAQPVPSTPWTLLFVVSSAELNQVLLPRFMPYGFILLGLILTLALTHALRQRLLIRPALALADYIKAESLDRQPAAPPLPALWRPWLRAVADAFAAKRRIERVLRESEEHFRTIAEAHPVAVCITGAEDRRILHASQAFADLFGIPLPELPGQDVQRFYADIKDRDRLMQMLREHGAVDGFELVQRRADGNTFPAVLSARPIEFRGHRAVVAGILDLSAQKEAEAEIARQREALHQSEKLSALGSLLAGVAHELNNPLSVVVGYASMLRDSTTDPTTRERARRVHAAATRCSRIVKSYLAMARKQPAERSPVQVNALIEAALDFTNYGLRTGDIEIVRDLAVDLPELLADGDQLIQVFTNLIVNAQHALQRIAPPRRLRLTTRCEEGGVRIEVADNGPGVPAEIACQIFEPFFTTKPQGVGTGIGLSVSQGIVAAHGGAIELEPAPGGGAAFTIWLPATEAAQQPVIPERQPPRPLTGRILVVEDEVEIGEMLAETLRRDGHETLLATSGRDALAKLDHQEVDLIISDLRMPDMDGPTLYRELSRIRPELAARTVFVTGDTLAADVTGFLSETGLPLIDKPIDPAEVRRRVQAFLANLRTDQPARP